MGRDGSKGTTAALSRIGQAPEVMAAVDATLATLLQITSALTPIVGLHGVGALYKRSLFLCLPRHTCLADVPDGTGKQTNGLNLAPLRAALLRQELATVMACSDDLLTTLNQLLISLIGAPLAERLLCCVWENSLCGPPPQDTLL